MQNFAIYVYTTHKNHERCKYIENTWGKNIENLFFITDREKNNKYIKCTDRDDYNSHIYKNFFAIKLGQEMVLKKNLEWHFLVGDDVYIYLNNFIKLLQNLNINENKIYGELYNCWPQDRSLYFPLGGGGILFNKTSINNFIYSEERIKTETIPADVLIGIICRDLSITMENVKGIFSQKPEFYNINNPEDFISFHYIKDEKQFKFLESKEK